MRSEVFAEHYARAGEPATERMIQIEELVQRIVPEVTPAISYGIPTFKLNGKNLVHWAGYARHVGFYPGAATMAEFAPRFADRVHAKGSVQFPHTEPLPLDLIEDMVRFRLTVEMSR